VQLQDIIAKLNQYWARQGCALLPPGASAWPSAGGPLCLAGAAGGPGLPPDGLEGRYRYLVLLRPAPAAARRLFLDSLRTAGIDRSEHDLRWLPFDERQASGSGRSGWLLLLDGAPFARFSYLLSCGRAEAAEIAVGLERLGMASQHKRSPGELSWAGRLTYGALHGGEAA
jgi:glycyl-tRNA synthetase alpha chain